jgi:hypothetical protein
MEFEIIALGVGLGAIALAAMMAAATYKGRKSENPIDGYVHHEISAEEFVEDAKKYGARTALTTVGKKGVLRMTIKDKIGHDIWSYETSDTDEQMDIIEAGDVLQKSGVHARRMRGDTSYLRKRVKRVVPRR